MSEYSVLDPESQQKIHENFWEKQSKIVDNINMRDLHLRIQDLPLARIKKIMKLDENVKMISAEVPILFAKAAELFISEITMRGWWCTEENKRRTLQKSDIALAASRYDQFDFLIDIVPREEIKMSVKKENNSTFNSLVNNQPSFTQTPQIQYYFQVPVNQVPVNNVPNPNLNMTYNQLNAINSNNLNINSIPTLLNHSTSQNLSHANNQNKEIIRNNENVSTMLSSILGDESPTSRKNVITSYKNSTNQTFNSPNLNTSNLSYDNQKLMLDGGNTTINVSCDQANDSPLQQAIISSLKNNNDQDNANNSPMVFQITHQQLEALLGIKIQGTTSG